MRDHSPTALTLLAEIGLTESAELLRMFAPRPQDDSPLERTATRLAHAAWKAVLDVDDAERRADDRLAQLEQATAEQRTAVENRHRRVGGWIAQASDRYQQEIAAIQIACDAFHAAAGPLAILADLTPAAEASV